MAYDVLLNVIVTIIIMHHHRHYHHHTPSSSASSYTIIAIIIMHHHHTLSSSCIIIATIVIIIHHNHHHHTYDHHCHDLPFFRLPSYKFKRSFIHLSTDSKTPLRDMKPYAPGFFGSQHSASIPVDQND